MTFELLRDVWQRRKWLAIVVAALMLAAVGGIVTSLPDVYRSTATVLVERHQLAEAFVRPSITGELDTRLQTISQEILSRARLEDQIRRFGLYPNSQAPMEVLVDKMRRDIHLDLKSVEQTNGRGATVAFALSFKGRDPQTVAAVTNALASFYVAANVKLREEQAVGTAEFLKLQLADMDKRLREQEQRVRDYRARYAGELPEQMAVNLATVERLQAQSHLNSADQLRAMDRRAALAKQLAEAKQPGAPGAPSSAMGHLMKLKQDLIALRQRFTDKYPEVTRVKAEIAALEREVAETNSEVKSDSAAVDPTVRRLETALSEADAEVDAFKAEAQRLRREVEAYGQRIENAPKREQEFRDLSRDYETTRELHASLLKRYEDARLAESMEQQQRGEQFRILDPALPERDPIAPNRLRLIIIGAALALGLAAAVVVVVEQLDTTFHSIDSLRAFTAAPILSSISVIVTSADAWRARRRFWLAAASVLLAIGLVVKGSQYLASNNDLLAGILTRGGS